ncbi:MAG: nicotinate dehydrogenase medium molybdopterin subunit, partial [Chloroflexota bacterium]|nr:nicotinate dehydrogenase medium molybdopterin subunit [Chloroflexota bacterium]
YALTDEVRVEKGINVTNTLAKCRIPTFREVPDFDCILIEDEEPKGPFGAKGISEVATVPITPAIINAIYDAVGVRITDLPATKERVMQALKTARRD